VVEAGIETAKGRAIFSRRSPVQKFFFLFGFLALIASPLSIFAQTADDPSETFLKAYMTAQQAEKLEHEGQFGAALAKYRFAGSLIEQLRKTHADWQPAIVDYRGRKVSEAILRVQGKTSTQQDLNAGPAQLPGNAPILPEQAGAPEPNVEITSSRPNETIAPAPRTAAVEPSKAPPPPKVDDAAIKDATRKLQSRIDQLEAELQKSREKFVDAQKEKDALDAKLKESASKLEKAQAEAGKGKDAEKKLRDQLEDAHQSLKKVESTKGSDSKAQEALRAEIATLKKNLAAVEQGRSLAEKERDDANARIAAADKRASESGKQRDEVLARLNGLNDAQKRVDSLITENSDLKKKLAQAEKSVRDLSADKPKKEQELAEVRRQVSDLQAKLAASQKQNQDSEARIVDLGKQLDDLNKQLEGAKVVGVSPEETARLTKENEILRNIVVRERQEEARREQAKKLMLAEFDKLKVKSNTLTEQIQLLAQPVTKLSDEELALLRQPVVSISDNSPGALKASFTFAKKSGNTPVTITDASGKPAPEQSEEEKANSPPGNFKPNVPDDLAGMARDAKENFDKGRYRTAEKLYQELLTKSPNNLYALSNLGVVYFRTGKLKAAELTLKKSIALQPKDEFSHTTLGIVYYRQSKFDDALTELTRALAINPKSATAHNYLGITASQKGWQEAAEKEMLEAIADNPDYADAHFNLAVIYATATPPAKELAKRHYSRATSLGAQPDPTLEKLLR
jgi:Flp pilus assembly protein TadD/septal ring factor EnvC (AmiA/AmiB activator)